MGQHVAWEPFLEQQLANPRVKEAYEAAGRAFELGESVVKLRQQRGWSQEKLAKVAGIRQSVLDGLELGGPIPPIEVLDRVAKALGVELEVRFKPQDRSSVS